MRSFLTRLVVGLAAGLVAVSCTSRPTLTAETATAVTFVDAATFAVGTQPAVVDHSYYIAAQDTLNISVFQVPDMTFEKIRVDAAGGLQFPLLGRVQAAGLTPEQLAADLARQLGARYLRNPQVTVTVEESVNQKVTVDGAVTQPGVFELRGRTTLVQAVAMARGAVRQADTRRVAVFRDTPGGRMTAVFDLAAIRAGQAEDPVILPNDVVVVDTSTLSLLMQDVLAVLPAVGVFYYNVSR